MSENGQQVFVPDFRDYAENRAKFPPEELMKYAGEHIAFSPDGTRLLAHGHSFEEVWAAMKAAGLNPHDAVWDQLDPPDVDSFL